MASIPAQARLSNTHSDTLKKFDEEIAELEARLLSLKLTRNQYASFTRLHPEILQEIFFVAQNSGYPQGKTTLAVTWVCHGWRELAHQTPSLWSHINFTNREWVETALSRTKNHELEFDFYEPRFGPTIQQSPSIDLIRFCFENLSRISSLRIRIGRVHYMSVSDLHSAPEWLVPAPLLKKLHFESLCLPHNSFSGIFPSLQSLHLTSCEFDWDALPILPSLRVLVIADPEERTSLEKIVQIFGILQQNLEELSLTSIIQARANPTTLPTRRISLIKLKRFEILEDSSVTAQLLGCISLPRHCQVEVYSSRDWNVVSALVASRNMTKWPIDYLRIEVESNTVGISFTLHIVEYQSEDENSEESRNVIHIGFGAAVPLLATPVFKLLPIHPLQKVVIHSHYDQDMEILTYIGELGTVENLSIQPGSMVVFVRYVQSRTVNLAFDVDTLEESSKVAAARAALSFSNLQTLTISGYTTAKDRWAKCADFLPLYHWLKRRMEYGFPLETLVLQGMPRSEVGQMEEMFLQVVRDGVKVEEVMETQPTSG